ncbi:hypothetical protein A9K55_001976 [Cordyceps militaris]|uniref:Uncharacterized protein n=1 Tax=Cordyceps militaris TaxID=73501 RepID=A0A2H4SSJ5_CORMI|nr:hypothetical protein A9K55_001976 [Cordyceps militaris]
MKILVAATAIIVGAICASGFVIVPTHLPNGVYEAQQQRDPSAHAIIKRVDGPAARSIGSKRRIDPRSKLLVEMLPLPKSGEFCRAENHTMAVADFHEAVNRLFYTPLFWLPRKSVRFAMHNGAVAYLCNLGDWSPGSLIEYMDAMRILDERCPLGEEDAAAGKDVVRAAKLSITAWEQFSGREVAGVPICQWEFGEKGGMKNDLLSKQKDGCRNYVSPGVLTILDAEIKCNDEFMGPGFWEKMRMLFPWYTRPQEAVITESEE